MASFVEQATLLVKDKSTDEIKQINRALKELFKTAEKLKSVNARITISGTPPIMIRETAKALVQLRNAQRGLKDVSTNVSVKGASAIERTARALADLHRLANRPVRAGGAVPLIPQNEINRLRGFAREAADLARQMSVIGAQGASTGLLEIGRAIRQMRDDARATEAALAGFGRNAIRQTTPRQQLQQQAMAKKPDWGFALGKDIGFGFKATIGFEIFNALRTAARSAGEGILNDDDARVLAGASLGNQAAVQTLFASARRAAEGTSGASTGLIAEAAIEQTAQLQQQFKAGRISLAEFNARVDATTRRIAENAQIFGTFSHDMARGAEQARQVEKALSGLGLNLSPVAEQEKINRAIVQAVIASGGDIGGDEVKRLLQQLGGAQRAALTERGLINAILMRDEGGRQSTAELRTSFQDLIRSDLNTDDLVAQIKQGLRDRSGKTRFTQDQLGDPIGLALDEIIPRLKKMGVNVNNATDVMHALDKELGFTGTGLRAFADIVANIEQRAADIERARTVVPEFILENPTLRAELANVESKFQDAAATLATNLLPSLKDASAGIAGFFQNISEMTPPTLDQWKALGIAGGATAALALTSGDAGTRALGVSAVALTGSATALTASAVALTTAAGAQGAASLFGRGAANLFGRGVGRAAAAVAATGLSGAVRFGGAVAVLLGAIEMFKAAKKTEQAKELDRQVVIPAIESIGSWLKGVRSEVQATIATDEINAIVEKSVQESQLRLAEVPRDLMAKPTLTPDEQTTVNALKAWDEVANKLNAAIPDIGSQDKLPLVGDTPTPVASELTSPTIDAMLQGMDARANTIAEAFGLGSEEIGAAGRQAGTDIATGGQTAATSVTQGFTTGGNTAGRTIADNMIAAAQQAGAAIAQAISNAAANVKVNVQQNGNNFAAPNTGGPVGGRLGGPI